MQSLKIETATTDRDTMTNQQQQLQALQARLGGNDTAEHAARMIAVYGDRAPRVAVEAAVEMLQVRRALFARTTRDQMTSDLSQILYMRETQSMIRELQAEIR